MGDPTPKQAGTAAQHPIPPPSHIWPVRVVFAIAFVILCVVGTLSYYSLNQLRDNLLAAQKSESTIDLLKTLVQHVRDMETDAGRYIITDNASHLDSYHVALAEIDADMAKLRVSIGDNADQQSRFAALTGLVEERKQVAGNLVALQSAARSADARALIAGGSGQRLTEEIAKVSEAMEGAEDAEMGERDLIADRYAALSKSGIVAGGLTAIGIAMIALFIMGRDLRARLVLEQELARSRDELEQRVEQRTAELRDRENQMRLVTDAMPALITYIDRDQRYVFINKTYEQWRLQKREEAIGKRVAEVIGPAQYKLLGPELEAVLLGQPRRFEISLEFEDGKRRHVQIAMIPDIGKDNCVVGAFSMAYDVTDRVLAEQSLAQLAAIVTSSDDAIVSKTLSGTVTSWNAAAERIFGYRADEIVGKSIGAIIPTDRLSEERVILESIAAGRPVRHYETVRRCKDDTLIDVSVTVSPVRDASGKIVAASKIARDVTRQKQIEVATRRANIRLNLLHNLDLAILAAPPPQAIAHIGMSSLHDLVPYWGATLMTFDFDANEATVLSLERPVQSAYDPGPKLSLDEYGWSDIERLRLGQECVVDDLGAMQVRSTVLERLFQKGMQSYARVPLIAEGQLLGVLNLASDQPEFFSPEYVGIARTIADQLAIALRQASLRAQVARHAAELEEKVAQRTVRLSELNKELEAFSYSVSHDLRAPVRHVATFAKLLLEQAQGLDDTALEYLGRIDRAAHRMNTLIDDLLSLARTGMVEVKFERVPLVELVDEIKGELAPQIGTRKIEWVVSGLPVVEGERSLLRIALFNLLANAVKYTRKVENARIEIGSGGTRDGFAEIYVRDNGAGFDMMYADKLFGVFQRLHSEREFEGTGVGLALVQRIVLRHGGTIRAHGEPGKGAEFSFTLRVGEESGARVD